MRYPTSDPVSPVLAEPSLFYDPPYERPVEDEFAWHLVKYLDPAVALAYQVKETTPCAPVWIDFLVEQGTRRVGIEIEDLAPTCEAFTTTLHRDALLVGSGAVDVLYRFRAADVLAHLHDVLLLAARLDPALFSERGRINLHTLASSPARAHHPQSGASEVHLVYPPTVGEERVDGELVEGPERSGGEVVVRRLTASRPAAWLAAYEAVLAQFGVDPGAAGRDWARSA